ncbi:MAG: NAD-dependent epimerase/dehydratase family protein [Thaumarchaeota archaeon]|nr:NAD-dependent epimerase/dehydratase family protein [Nitrososphaerota archaeon]
MKRALVAGAGGFIGHHLVNRLKSEGYYVRGVDLKYPEFEPTMADDFIIADLRGPGEAFEATHSMDDVYQLAADMGGIGYITSNLADIARNNVLINVNMLDAAVANNIKRYLYTSSACIYPRSHQLIENATPLREEDAIPADPEAGYGWEKLFSEQMVQYYAKDHDLDTRIVRFHNVYGPLGTYDGGKEKSPAALCRKIAKAFPYPASECNSTTDIYKYQREGKYPIEIWGDGNQTRTYLYIDDCIEGLRRIMQSGYSAPLNLGTNALLSINELALLIGKIAGKPLILEHVDGPQGVRGRSSDNGRLYEVLGWGPSVTLREGLTPTYQWIEQQVRK